METSAHVCIEAVEDHEKELEDDDSECQEELETDSENSSDDIKMLDYTSDSD